MNFIEAMQWLEEGGKVRRKSWMHNDYHLFKDNDTHKIKCSHKTHLFGILILDFNYIIHNDDVQATDWVVYEKPSDKERKVIEHLYKLKEELHSLAISANDFANIYNIHQIGIMDINESKSDYYNSMGAYKGYRHAALLVNRLIK